MKLVEQHVIDRKDSRYSVIDAAAFASKNLYNAALYEIRQAYIFQGRYLTYSEMDKRMQPHEAYKALPAKVAQHVLRVLDDNWTAFFEARQAYDEIDALEDMLGRFTGFLCAALFSQSAQRTTEPLQQHVTVLQEA